MEGSRVWMVFLFAISVCADIDPGQIGLQFFGNEYAHTQPVTNFPATEMSITMRIKASSGNVLSYGMDQQDSFDGNIFSLGSVSSLEVKRGSGTSWNTGINFSDNQWHALAITWKMSTGETKIYKDGVSVGQTVIARSQPITVGGFLLLGQRPTCANGCFTKNLGLVGTIADLTLWKRVLTSDQVTYLATNSPSGDETDMVSYWPLYQNSGSDSTDKAAGGNTLLLGGPKWVQDVQIQESNSSIAFHGYDAVIIEPSTDLPTADFTVEFWIKTSVMDDTVILSYFVEGASNKYPFVIRNPALVTLVRNGNQIRTDSNLATGAWNHAAFTWTSSTGRLTFYLNGGLAYPPSWLPVQDYDLMDPFDKGASLVAQPTRVSIGNQVSCTAGSCLVPGSGLVGMLQEIRVWSVVRSATDISNWRSKPLPDPFPDTLRMYLKLDEGDSSRTTSDAANTNANTGTLTAPMWKNTMIAPPFPTLSEVNTKVVELKNQMAELLDFVKEVMEPTQSITTKEEGFTVQEEPRCDRRYKYQCTFHTQAIKDTQEQSGGESQKVHMHAMLQEESSSLVENLEPKRHHRRGQTIETVSDRQAVDLLQTDEAVSSSVSITSEDADANAQMSATESSAAAVRSGTRRRHAWAVPTPTFGEGVTVAGASSEENSHRPTHTLVRSITDTARASPMKRHHAWAAGHFEKQDPRKEQIVPDASASDGLAEFLEEDEGQEASDLAADQPAVPVVGDAKLLEKRLNTPQPSAEQSADLEDGFPEKLARRKMAHLLLGPQIAASVQRTSVSTDSDDDDLTKVQREFEDQERKFDNFASEGESDFPQGWNFDESSAPTQQPAVNNQEASQADDDIASNFDPSTISAQDSSDTPQSPVPTNARLSTSQPTAQATVEFAQVTNNDDKEQKQQPPHHHHHHHHHHSSSSSSSHPSSPAPPPVQKPLVPRQQLINPTPATPAAPAAQAVPQPQQQHPKVDNGGMGTKYEQLVMPGAESEWDEAIAEGIGNSDLASEGIPADAVGNQ